MTPWISGEKVDLIVWYSTRIIQDALLTTIFCFRFFGLNSQTHIEHLPLSTRTIRSNLTNITNLEMLKNFKRLNKLNRCNISLLYFKGLK